MAVVLAISLCPASIAAPRAHAAHPAATAKGNAACMALSADYETDSKKLALSNATALGDDRGAQRNDPATLTHATMTMNLMAVQGCKMPAAARSADRHGKSAIFCSLAEDKLIAQRKADESFAAIPDSGSHTNAVRAGDEPAECDLAVVAEWGGKMSAASASFCASCGAGLPSGAQSCPGYGAQLNWEADASPSGPPAKITRSGRRTSIILALILGNGLWSAYANGLFGHVIQEQADETMANVQARVAADAVKQYDIASRSGDESGNACKPAWLRLPICKLKIRLTMWT